MDTRKVYLRIEGQGGAPAEFYANFLERLTAAYRSLAFLERGADLDPENVDAPYSLVGPYYVHAPDVLRMTSVRLESPGFWEFLGNINPLETIRKYLNDRHERKKDMAYRSRLDQEKLEIENNILKLEMVERAIDILRKAGAADEEIQQRIREHALLPLMQLGVFQDRKLIESAKTRVPDDKPRGPAAH